MIAGTTPDRRGTEPGVPESPPLYERFTVTYPSRTVIESFYTGGATLREIRVTHRLAAVVEGKPQGSAAALHDPRRGR